MIHCERQEMFMSNEHNSRTARRQKSAKNGRRATPTKKPKSIKKIVKKLFLVAVIAALAVFIGGVGLFAYYASSAPDLDEDLLKDPLTSDILDINGEVIYKFGTEKRDFVPYEEIPQLMEDAILATEDVRFYKHHGMDFYRLGGAILANFRSGFGSQGASTLTQQVIKNSFLSEEKTLKRKAQEAWLAFKLEREYSKEEIFEMYINKVLMSGRIHGFGTASTHFYGKPLNELELHEVALLAGLPQSPNGYNPFRNPERAEKRRNIVLTLMEKHGKITKAEMDAAKAIPVTASLLPEDQREDHTNSQYAAYIDIVLDELEAEGMLDILAEGVKVQTALDPNVQSAVENAIDRDEWYESEEMEAGMTVVDTKTGAIVAVGGGRNYSGRDLNFASDQKRQPGSVIKPILSYGPAIEYFDWSTGQRVVDEPYNYKGTKQPIRNVDGKYQGPITIREALYRSRNIPAVKVFEEVGTKRAGEFAESLGLPYEKLNSSNAIGGGEYNFSTIQMAGAYAAFGNSGIYTKPHTVKKIIMRDGKTERNLTPTPTPVMKDSTAYMVTDILRDVLTESTGTGRTAHISGLDVAGKTGTTNYSSDTLKKHGMKGTDVPDTWFAGYTTNYTIAVWGGYKDYTTPIQTYDKGRFVPQNLFRTVMSEISSGQETPRFSKPSSVEEATIVYGSDPIVLASSTTPKALQRTELFVRGTVPVEIAEEEVVELNAPGNLSATFDANQNVISLQWDYETPDPEYFPDGVTFHVEVSVDGEPPQELTQTNGTNVTFSNIEFGRTYTFYVKAVSGETESAKASTSLLVDRQEEVIEPEVPTVPEEEVPTPPEEEEPSNNNGNQQPPGNPNNNPGNGNQGNGGNQQQPPVTPPQNPTEPETNNDGSD